MIYAREKQQTPAEVYVTIYDVDAQGNIVEQITRASVYYNTSFRFCYYGFVLYEDKEFKKEIDPNEEIVLTQDIVVYRRDNLDRVPVFFNVHYYTNGVEEYIGAQDTFFRGELLKSGKFISDRFGYELYYDMGKTQKVFEDDGFLIVRETDDKKNIYGFREDRSQIKVTFKYNGNELCTKLLSVGDRIDDSYYLHLGTKTYVINDCNVKGQPLRGDTEVEITDCDVTPNYAVTVHLCYNGDVKRTCVDYPPVGIEWKELSESDGYYTDADLTQPFVGTVSSATTLYQAIYVDFNRMVDSAGW